MKNIIFPAMVFTASLSSNAMGPDWEVKKNTTSGEPENYYPLTL